MRLSLASLAAAALTLSVPAASERLTEYRIVKLEKGWQLLFNLPDFDYRGTQKSGSLTTFTYQHSSEQITLWVHLYRAKELATTDGCKYRMNEKLEAGGILPQAVRRYACSADGRFCALTLDDYCSYAVDLQRQRYVPVPAVPTANLVVVQPDFLLGLFESRLDRPAAACHAYQFL